MSKGNRYTNYDLKVTNETSSQCLQMATIKDSGDVHLEEGTASDPDEYFDEKRQKIPTTSKGAACPALTSQGYKRQEDLKDDDDDRVSTREDKRKDRRFENSSDHAKRRDRRDEHISGYGDRESTESRNGEDKYNKYPRKSKAMGKEREYSSQATSHRSKSRSDTLQFQHDESFLEVGSSSGVIAKQNQGTGDNFAVVENQGTIKHILMLGTIGSGKYTIAKNISSDSQNFPSRSSLRKQSGIIQCIDDGRLFKFVLVDTGGARMPDVWGAKGPTISEIAGKIKHHLKGGISLIMVIVRYDCDTPEDFQVLCNMIDALFTDEAKQHIALVHNGCETLSREGVKHYIKHFNGQGPSGRLASLCGKAPALATAFPNLREAKVEMVEYFKQAIQESKIQLSTLIESCKFFEPYSAILKTTNDPSRVFPDSKQDCCVM